MRVPNKLLQEIFENNTVVDATNNSIPLHSHIALHLVEALYDVTLQTRPNLVIEVGMAFGISSLAIATALKETGKNSKLISIDPFQSSEWKGIGKLNIERAGLDQYHELIEIPDYVALPELLTRGIKADMAYVDGWHSFDYVLVDFFYLDKLLSAGGIIGFNDCGLRSVNKAINFIRSHRKYQEFDVGLKLDFRSRNPLYSIARRIMNISHSDRYFRKIENWEPNWNYYSRF